MDKLKLVFTFLLLSPHVILAQSLRQQMIALSKQSECDTNKSPNRVAHFREDASWSNGYYYVEYAVPGCGCECRNTVGAYTKDDGSYALLSSSYGQCSFDNGLRSNLTFDNFFPPTFGLQTFFENPIGLPDTSYPALFYLTAKIPKRGTETVLNLKLVPLGMNLFSQNGLCYRIYEDDYTRMNNNYYGYYEDMAKKISGSTAINLMMNGEFKKLNASDKGIVDSIINRKYHERNCRFRSYSQIEKSLHHLFYIYSWYNKLSYTIIVMDWDVAEGRFYIKEKKGRPKRISYLDFLRSYNFYWYIAC